MDLLFFLADNEFEESNRSIDEYQEGKEWSWTQVVNKAEQNGGQFDSVRQQSVLFFGYTATVFLILCPCS